MSCSFASSGSAAAQDRNVLTDTHSTGDWSRDRQIPSTNCRRYGFAGSDRA